MIKGGEICHDYLDVSRQSQRAAGYQAQPRVVVGEVAAGDPPLRILAFLWLAFFVLSVVAFFAILFTGRYPQAIFDFNVGVLRWTLAGRLLRVRGSRHRPVSALHPTDAPDYPAHLDIAYPDRLSRGLVLVKWWLLAIPHYLIIGLFVGGGLYVVSEAATSDRAPGAVARWPGRTAGGLAAVVLLFTGRYPRPCMTSSSA